MCVRYVSFMSKIRPRTFGCVAMGSVMLFILIACIFHRVCLKGVQVVLSGFSVRLLCFVQAKKVV